MALVSALIWGEYMAGGIIMVGTQHNGGSYGLTGSQSFWVSSSCPFQSPLLSELTGVSGDCICPIQEKNLQ